MELRRECVKCHHLMELVVKEGHKTTDPPMVWKCLCGHEEAMTVADVRRLEGEP